MAKSNQQHLKATMYRIIFESDTPAGRTFDIILIIAILASVAVVMLDSIADVHDRHGPLLYRLEWAFTILFTIEYVLRLYCVPGKIRYAVSFFGIIDLLAILPTWLSVFIFHTRYLMVVRILRVLRIFRVLKLGHHVRQADLIRTALAASRRKIVVFMMIVLTLVVVIGSLMYLIEGPEHGFTSIPISVYWAVVTLTTVGYGDLSPATPLGRAFSVVVMLMGYSIIAVPTGIVTAHIAAVPTSSKTEDAMEKSKPSFCPHCGKKLI